MLDTEYVDHLIVGGRIKRINLTIKRKRKIIYQVSLELKSIKVVGGGLILVLKVSSIILATLTVLKMRYKLERKQS